MTVQLAASSSFEAEAPSSLEASRPRQLSLTSLCVRTPAERCREISRVAAPCRGHRRGYRIENFVDFGDGPANRTGSRDGLRWSRLML